MRSSAAFLFDWLLCAYCEYAFDDLHCLDDNAETVTSFQEYERPIRGQMTDIFARTGFDARRDITGIILNPWGHAYVNPQPGFFFGKHGKPDRARFYATYRSVASPSLTLTWQARWIAGARFWKRIELWARCSTACWHDEHIALLVECGAWNTELARPKEIPKDRESRKGASPRTCPIPVSGPRH